MRRNNQALVALLGLGLATTVVPVASIGAVSLIRNLERPEVRLPVFVMVIASFVTAIEIGMNAYFHELYKILGIFIPLIVTNCTIIGRAETFASKNNFSRSLLDDLSIGIGFTLVVMTQGGMRELVGQGTLFDQAHLMFGDAAQSLTLKIENFPGMLVAIPPPGAFSGPGLMITAKNLIDKRLAQRKRTVSAVPDEAQGVTG